MIASLRMRRANKIISFLVRRAGRWVIKYQPALAFAVKPYLKRYPSLWEKLKVMVLQDSGSPLAEQDSFIPVVIKGVELFFAKGPLEDRRGIGRVTRELLGQLQKLAGEAGERDRTKMPCRVYFYSSIHWCPDVLPSPSVVMIHDVIPMILPEWFPEASKTWAERYAMIARQADVVLTISNSSAEDISQQLAIPRGRIRVIFNGVTELPIADEAQVILPDGPYVVYVGSWDYHKNIEVVLRAMQETSVREIALVLIGDNRGGEGLVAKYGLVGRVHFFGCLKDEQVGYVVSRSLALVFPSLYEGFGLPPFEAALLGVPSICSARPAMTDLLDGAALFAAPDSPTDWATAISNLLDDGDLREEIAAAAKLKAMSFTWDHCGARFADLLRGLEALEN
jgi:glycosyltransferase involved in cell wall biosynthesis